MPDLLGMSAGTAGSIIAVVGIAGLDKFERDLQKMATAVDGKAQFLNKSLTAVAAAGATVFVSSIAAATEFQSSFTGVTKTVDGLSDNFGNLTAEGQRLADQFRALSLEVPVSVNELNKIGELAGQLGVGKEDILEFTRTIAALGVTTNLTFEEGSTQIARFINVTKQVAPAGSQMAEQAERIGSAVVELGNNMATTEAEIVTFGLRIAGSGAQIGLTQDQILAFGAALSSVGIQAEMGGTAISKLFIDMAKAVSDGGAQLERMAKIAGMTIPEFSRLFKEDAAGAINAFFTGLNETQKSGESLFPILEEMGYKEVRLRDTILKTASASDILSEALGWSSKAYRENTAMADEAQKRYSTFKSQLKLFDNAVNDAAITLGNKMLPALNDVFSVINSNNAVVTTLLDTVGTMVLVLGGLAVAIKTYRGASELWRAANVALNGSFGPVLLAVTALVAVITAIKVAQDKYQESILRGIDAASDQIREIEKLELQYNNLSKQTDLTVAEQEELKKITEELDGLYRNNGISIMEMAKSFGSLSSEIRAAKLDDLRTRLAEINAEIEKKTGNKFLDYSAQIKLLKEESAALTGEIKELSSMEATYQKLNINTTESMKEQISALEAVRSQTEKGTVQYKELTDRIEQLKNKLDEAAGKKAPIDWQKAIADAGYKTVESMQAQIREIETLMKHVEPGSSPWRAMRDDLNDLYAQVGKVSPFYKLSQDALGFYSVGEDVTQVTGKIRNNFEQLPEPIGEVDQKISKLGDSTEKGGKDWVAYASYLNDITSRFGEAGDLIGKGANLIATAVTGSFDPLTFGLNAAGFAIDALSTGFGLFKKEADPVPKTIEEVEASLGELQARIESTNEIIGQLGFSSTYITGLQGAIDEYKEDMRVASGYWYDVLAGSIEQFQKILEDLTYAFKYEDVFATATGSLDILIEKAQYYTEYFGNIDMSGFSTLLLGEIQNGQKLLATLDPTSRAYEDLITKLRDAYNWYGQLSGQTNILMTLYPEMADQLARIYEASKLNAEAAGDESVMLEVLKNSRVLHATSVEEQIAIYESLMSMVGQETEEYKALETILTILKQSINDTTTVIDHNSDVVDENTVAVDKNRVSHKALAVVAEDATAIIEESNKNYTKMSTVVDESGESFKRAAAQIGKYNFILDETLQMIRKKYTEFEEGVRFIGAALDEINYFKFDIDMTDLDEKALASLKNVYAYMQNLNPNSEAFLDAQKAFDQLLGKFYQIGYSWEDIARYLNIPVRGEIQFGVKVVSDEGGEDIVQNNPVLGEAVIDYGALLKSKISVMQNALFLAQQGLGDLQAAQAGSLAQIAEKYNEQINSRINTQRALENEILELGDRLKKINEQYSEQINQKLAEQRDIEKEIYDLVISRTEIHKEYEQQINALRSTSGKISDVLQDIMADQEPLTIRRIEEAVFSLSGVARSFVVDWDAMLDRLMGGTKSEYEEMEETAKSAQTIIDKAKYFGVNIFGTEVESQLNAMIFSIREFLSEINPDSQAYKDAQETIGNLVSGFEGLGGVLDEGAAQRSAADWAEQVRVQLEQQMQGLRDEEGKKIIAIDADIDLAKQKIAEIDNDVLELMARWQQEQLSINTDIMAAKQTIVEIDDEIRALMERWEKEELQIAVDIDNAKNKIAILEEQLQNLIETYNNQTIKLNVETGINTGLNDITVASGGKPGGGNFSVNVYGATPDTWVSITDKEIEPRINERNRRFTVGENPYAG